jgi:transposase
MERCPRCGEKGWVIRAGRNDSGSQRYECRECGHYFTPKRVPQGIAPEVRERAVQLYLEGMSYRGIGRLLGVNHQSVMNWVKAKADHLPASVTAAEEPDIIEVDELVSFIGQKKPTSTC